MTVHVKGGALNGQDPLFPVGYVKECFLCGGRTCHPVPRIAQCEDLEPRYSPDGKYRMSENAGLCLRLPQPSSCFPVICAFVPPSCPLRGRSPCKLRNSARI
jgi:hypothetical protein